MKDVGLNCSPQPSLDACDDFRSQALMLYGCYLDCGKYVGLTVSGISACLGAAYAMLPLGPLKPVWEQRVWADIFGEGVFMNSHWCAARLAKSTIHTTPTVLGLESQSVTKKARVKRASDNLQSYSGVVVHKSRVSWQGERESLMQNTFKRWWVTTAYIHPSTAIGTQLDDALQEIDNVTLLADVFRGRASATLQESVRPAEKLCAHFGINGEPWDSNFSGAILLATYFRDRWADLMHCDQVMLDEDSQRTVHFSEGHTATHKAMREAVFKHQFLCFIAVAFGVISDLWPQTWLEGIRASGVMLPPYHCVLSAPDEDGCPTKRPLPSAEASQWLRGLLTVDKHFSAARKIPTQSFKAICFSYRA